jgi:predicted CoA-binding protein
MGKSVAIIGASNDRNKFGNKAVRAFARKGYRVCPVNPRVDEVEGLRAYRSILDIPSEVDVVSLYVPPSIGETLLEDIAKKRPKKLYVNPGAESDELVRLAESLGLRPLLACSIRAIGLSPEEV